MLIRNAEIAGRRTSLRCENGIIVEIADQIETVAGDEEIDASGGALLPGLHDHHLHLLSLAAQMTSLKCGPPEVTSKDALIHALRKAKPSGGWIRGTGYFESVAGPLDRVGLDAIRADVPIRIQHRSGSMWFLNSRALEILEPNGQPGRDAKGRASGRLFRADDWLRQNLTTSLTPDLALVGQRLARYGVTRVTDATPSTGLAEANRFRAAQQSLALPQRLRLMGRLDLCSFREDDWLKIAEVKIMLDEPVLPDFDALTNAIEAAHAADRRVAMHTVTRTEIHFALAAFDAAGALRGDRLEHASVAPDEAVELARHLGISIVTQPNFISERGDDYHEAVDAKDWPCLYRVESWREGNVPLAAGTDAPFGDPDPWRAMRAAVTRQTDSGACLGPSERVSPEVAFDLFRNEIFDTGSSAKSGDATRSLFGSVHVGRKADLCLLNSSWREAREDLSSERVVMTVCAGRIIWREGA